MNPAPDWKCLKCAARDPILVPGHKGGHGGVPTTHFIFGNVHPSLVVCSACGFVEEYFDAPELEALRAKHGSAGKHPRRS